eukprot:COSAG02_NODE_419_length_22613_cov_22.994492_13_plen_255_part_00
MWLRSCCWPPSSAAHPATPVVPHLLARASGQTVPHDVPALIRSCRTSPLRETARRSAAQIAWHTRYPTQARCRLGVSPGTTASTPSVSCATGNGVNRHGKAGPWPPVANETDPKCVPRKSWKNPGTANITCMTGTITPTPAPLPPKPPAVFKGFIGTEAHPEYVDGAVGMRAPTRVGNSSEPLNATTELTDKGWPKMDCDITIFDHRPTHAWAPPMDDPEHRQVDLSGTWTLSKKSAAVAVAVAAAVVAETNSC